MKELLPLCADVNSWSGKLNGSVTREYDSASRLPLIPLSSAEASADHHTLALPHTRLALSQIMAPSTFLSSLLSTPALHIQWYHGIDYILPQLIAQSNAVLHGTFVHNDYEQQMSKLVEQMKVNSMQRSISFFYNPTTIRFTTLPCRAFCGCLLCRWSNNLM